MDYNLIKPFLAVFRTSSYTKAAEELDVSQPAISQSIKRLEQLLDKPLFIKQGRGIVPTSYASQLAHRLIEPFDSIDMAISQPDKLKMYSQEHYSYSLSNIPDLELIESPASEDKLLADLRSMKVDLAIDICGITDAAFISDLIDDRVVIVAAKDHPRIQGTITEQEYYQESHITVMAQRRGGDVFDLIADKPRSRNIHYAANSPMSQLVFVSNSECIGLTTERAALILADSLGLQVLSVPMNIELMPFRLIYHKRNLHNERHKDMREKILATLHRAV